MKEIPLTQSKIALIDDDVYEWAKDYKWFANKRGNTFYVGRNFLKINGKFGVSWLHHYVIGYPLNDLEIDHKDGNGLNNQRNNLEVKTHRGNQLNRHTHRKGRLIGATWVKGRRGNKNWISRIVINGKIKRLGYFYTELDAHNAYIEELNKL